MFWCRNGLLLTCLLMFTEPPLGLWKTVSYSSKKLRKMWRGWRRKPPVSQMSWTRLFTQGLSVSQSSHRRPSLVFFLFLFFLYISWQTVTGTITHHPLVVSRMSHENGIADRGKIGRSSLEPFVQPALYQAVHESCRIKGDISHVWLNMADI